MEGVPSMSWRCRLFLVPVAFCLGPLLVVLTGGEPWKGPLGRPTDSFTNKHRNSAWSDAKSRDGLILSLFLPR